MRNRVDVIDIKILNLLQSDSAVTNKEIAKELGVSEPTIMRRLEKLFEAKIIKGYRTITNTEFFGYTKKAIVEIVLMNSDLHTFITNCHLSKYVTGCFILEPPNPKVTTTKVVCFIQYQETRLLSELTDDLTKGIHSIIQYEEHDVKRLEKWTEIQLDESDID